MYQIRTWTYVLSFLFIGSPVALAQSTGGILVDPAAKDILNIPADQRPITAPDSEGFENLAVDPYLQKTHDKISSESFRVLREKEGVFEVQVDKTYGKGQLMIFMRPNKSGVDVLAHGQVIDQKGDIAQITLLLDAMSKVPYKGDLVVPIAPPWFPPRDRPDPADSGAIATEPAPLPPDPGYIQLNYGAYSGSMKTQNSEDTNNAKQVPAFRFPYIHFAWYLDFLWRIGIEYESLSGPFPTSTYLRKEFDSSQSISTFTLNYRLRRSWNGHFRPTIRLVSLSDEFLTNNDDENLITTTASGLGLGARWAYEHNSVIWKPAVGSGAAFHSLFLDTTYYVTGGAKDELVTRGSQGLGSGYEWRIGFNALGYLDFIPYVNRFILEGFYGTRILTYKFSGDAKSAKDGFYTIPNGGSTTETNTYWVISLGIRLDDYIGRLFVPK